MVEGVERGPALVGTFFTFLTFSESVSTPE